jgi:hypothetical protein
VGQAHYYSLPQKKKVRKMTKRTDDAPSDGIRSLKSNVMENEVFENLSLRFENEVLFKDSVLPGFRRTSLPVRY